MNEHKCLTCKYAEWSRTKAGRLHPDGDGRCTYVVQFPAVPASMWFGTFGMKMHKPSGGYISRRTHTTYTECPTWEKA